MQNTVVEREIAAFRQQSLHEHNELMKAMACFSQNEEETQKLLGAIKEYMRETRPHMAGTDLHLVEILKQLKMMHEHQAAANGLTLQRIEWIERHSIAGLLRRLYRAMKRSICGIEEGISVTTN